MGIIGGAFLMVRDTEKPHRVATEERIALLITGTVVMLAGCWLLVVGPFPEPPATWLFLGGSGTMAGVAAGVNAYAKGLGIAAPAEIAVTLPRAVLIGTGIGASLLILRATISSMFPTP